MTRGRREGEDPASYHHSAFGSYSAAAHLERPKSSHVAANRSRVSLHPIASAEGGISSGSITSWHRPQA